MKSVYAKFSRQNEVFQKAGRLEKFYQIICPITVVEVDILQKPTESFEEIERLILSLLEAGIQTAKEIEELTGIPENYGKKLIALFREQKLVEENNNTLTNIGKLSLQTGERVVTKLEKRRVQINGLTGKILPKRFQLYENQLFRIEELENYDFYQYPIQEKRQVIEDNIWDKMEKNVEEYVDLYNQTSSSNVDQITTSEIIGTSYTFCYLAKFEHLQEYVLIAATKRFENNQMNFSYEPLSISETDAKWLTIEEKEIIDKDRKSLTNFIQDIILSNAKQTGYGKEFIDYLAELQAERTEKQNCYRIDMKNNWYNPKLVYLATEIGKGKPENPYFPDYELKFNGEVFYFYVEEEEEYEKWKEIVTIIHSYQKEVASLRGNKKLETCKQDNKEAIQRVVQQYPEKDPQMVENCIAEFKKALSK